MTQSVFSHFHVISLSDSVDKQTGFSICLPSYSLSNWNLKKSQHVFTTPTPTMLLLCAMNLTLVLVWINVLLRPTHQPLKQFSHSVLQASYVIHTLFVSKWFPSTSSLFSHFFPKLIPRYFFYKIHTNGSIVGDRWLWMDLGRKNHLEV